MNVSKLFSVANKNVLITGGSRGLGFMIASGFAANGANVLITSRDENACKEAVDQMLASPLHGGGQCHFVPSSVSTRDGCRELAQHARDLFDGKLDVLVNNAGANWREDPYDRESAKRMSWGWDRVLDVNLKGVFFLTRECVPMLQRFNPNTDEAKAAAEAAAAAGEEEKMRSFEDPGRIINIGSCAGVQFQNLPTHAYDASKAAVHHLSKKMSGDLAQRGVTVNCIAPGVFPSRMSDRVGDDPNDMLKNIPLGRLGMESDIAGACLFLSSKAGSFCTGTVMSVDGGHSGATPLIIGGDE